MNNKKFIKYIEKIVAKYTPIVHEMCHIITDPFYSIAIDRYASAEELRDRREQLTDHIANAFFKMKK